MTPEKYIDRAEPYFQDKLKTLRNLVHGSDSEVQEQLRGDFIYFTIKDKDFCALKAQKNYVSLYVFNHDVVEEYKEELSKFNPGVCCVRFTKTKDIPVDLLREIVDKTVKSFK